MAFHIQSTAKTAVANQTIIAKTQVMHIPNTAPLIIPHRRLPINPNLNMDIQRILRQLPMEDILQQLLIPLSMDILPTLESVKVICTARQFHITLNTLRLPIRLLTQSIPLNILQNILPLQTHTLHIRLFTPRPTFILRTTLLNTPPQPMQLRRQSTQAHAHRPELIPVSSQFPCTLRLSEMHL
jgi:hypothetical protein